MATLLDLLKVFSFEKAGPLNLKNIEPWRKEVPPSELLEVVVSEAYYISTSWFLDICSLSVGDLASHNC